MGTYIHGAPGAFYIIGGSDEVKRDNRAYPWDTCQPTCQRAVFGDLLDFRIKGRRLNADGLVHNDQGCEDSLQDRAACDDLSQLVPEVPAAPACTDRPKPDAEGFQAAARLAFNVHADTDEPFAGRE